MNLQAYVLRCVCASVYLFGVENETLFINAHTFRTEFEVYLDIDIVFCINFDVNGFRDFVLDINKCVSTCPDERYRIRNE